MCGRGSSDLAEKSGTISQLWVHYIQLFVTYFEEHLHSTSRDHISYTFGWYMHYPLAKQVRLIRQISFVLCHRRLLLAAISLCGRNHPSCSPEGPTCAALTRLKENWLTPVLSGCSSPWSSKRKSLQLKPSGVGLRCRQLDRVWLPARSFCCEGRKPDGLLAQSKGQQGSWHMQPS